jgi:hypothetical protein
MLPFHVKPMMYWKKSSSPKLRVAVAMMVNSILIWFSLWFSSWPNAYGWPALIFSEERALPPPARTPKRPSATAAERVSDACEASRRLAKKHHAVVILVSQVSRKQGDKNEVREVSLHDAKESGSFENSCSLVLGLWKTGRVDMRCRVIKNSRGLSGQTVGIKIRGGTYILYPCGQEDLRN